MNYRTWDGREKHLGSFGRSTKQEFDEAIASLPELIAFARDGNEVAGQTAVDLLWALANEGFNTRKSGGIFEQLFPFGN